MATGIGTDNPVDTPTRPRLLLATARDRLGRRPSTLPAVIFVIVYMVLLFCIPSQLIVRPLGAPGTPANLWGIAALLWWFVATLGGQNPTRGWTPLRTVFGLLTVAVLCSYVAGMTAGWYAPVNIHQETDELWTLVLVQADDLNEKMITAADRGLLSFAGWAGMLLITAEGIRTWKHLDLLVTWISGLGAFVATLGIIQYFSGLDIAGFFTIPGLSANSEFGAVSSRSVLNRVSSTAVHPIEFGVVMAACFLLSLHRSLYTKRMSAWVPTLLIGVAIPMSVSRSAIVAVVLGLVIVFVGWPPRWRFRALVLAPFAVVGLRLLAPGLLGTIRSLFTNLFNDPSVTGRTSDYSAVFNVLADSPVFGRGLFTFVPRYYRILDNQFLMLLLELGVVGLVALGILIISGILMVLAARRQMQSPEHKNLALSVAGAIAGLALSYATFDAWSFPMVGGVTFVLLGMAAAIRQITRPEPPSVAAQAKKSGLLAEGQRV